MQSMIAGFVISRSGVQVSAPAPCRINHLQRLARICISGAVVVFVLLSSPAYAQERAPGRDLILPSAVFIGLHAADVHSTHLAISSGNGHEGNPFMRMSTGKQAAVKAGVTVGTVFLLSKLHAKHPKTAQVTFWIVNAVMVGIVQHNYRIAGRR